MRQMYKVVMSLCLFLLITAPHWIPIFLGYYL